MARGVLVALHCPLLANVKQAHFALTRQQILLRTARSARRGSTRLETGQAASTARVARVVLPLQAQKALRQTAAHALLGNIVWAAQTNA